jgi:hypothetical protein
LIAATGKLHLHPPEQSGQAFARVAELVDAADSKSAVRKDVLVRFQSRALKKLHSFMGLFLLGVGLFFWLILGKLFQARQPGKKLFQRENRLLPCIL